MSKNNSSDLSLWDLNIKNSFRDIKLDNFREPQKCNDKLGVWSIKENSSRYYKALMYEFALYLDNLLCIQNKESLIEISKKIKRQNLGNPTTIEYFGENISLDYILAFEELNFCDEVLQASEIICEIGAGFGRTCHSILSIYKIKKYIIIDIPEILNLSKKFLKNVLDKENFEKIIFVDSIDYKSVQKADLIINIDSFQEIPNKAALDYMNWISENANYFFSKNAMGKYNPNDIDLEIRATNEYVSALQMGIMHNRYKLYNTNERTRALEEYFKVFCPKKFKLHKSQRGFGQYLQYQLALFKKN